jgi:hypothetical protein
MATSISYNNFSFSGVSGYPVPAVSISQEFQRDGGGRHIGTTASIVLEGKIYSGSGDKGFDHLLVLESGLRDKFSKDGGNLIISCGSTSSTFSGIKVGRYSANKTEDQWTTTIDYSIDLVSEIANTGSGIFYVSSTQDDWNIETIDENSYNANSISFGMVGFGTVAFAQGANYPFYRISRTLGAVGKYIPEANNEVSGTKTPVKHAKEWVNFHLPIAPQYTGIINGLTLYNFVRSINTSDTEGSYRITDNWIGVPLGALPYTESFTIESSLDNSMMRTVTVQGTIKGLEPFQTGNIYIEAGAPYLTNKTLAGSLDRMNTPSTRIGNNGYKFYNAMSGYSGIKCDIYNRARNFIPPASTTNSSSCGFNFSSAFGRNESMLHPIPISITEGFNPAEGSITYNFSYNNRPLNLIPGSISETLSVDDTFATPIIASIFVLGRQLGPILQDLGTITSSSRRVTFEVVFPKPSSLRDITFNPTHYSAITGLVESFNPQNLTTNPQIGATTNNGGIRAYVKSDTSNWNVSEGRLSKEKTWEWVKCYT